MIKGIIFDLDGTLLNTIEDIGTACNYALHKMGFPQHQINDFKKAVGDGRTVLIERIIPPNQKNEETIQKTLELFDEYYNKHMIDKTKPYEGVLELLEWLKTKNYKVAVVSNKPHEFTTKIVAKFLGDNFSVVYGHRQGYKTKPDPQSVLEVIEKFELSKDEVIYIGDSDVDIKTAKNTGVESVGVLWGFRSEEELKNEGATYTVKTVEDLKNLITDMY